jgi:hypothetical protein
MATLKLLSWEIEGHKQEIIALKTGLFVPGGRNTEHRMIALRVQNPAARHEEAILKGTAKCSAICRSKVSPAWHENHGQDHLAKLNPF